MKKAFFLLIVVLCVPAIAIGKVHSIKLRTSVHPGFLRIVLEGSETVVKRAVVNQKAQNILVSFLSIDVSVQSEKADLDYRNIDQSTVMLSPGRFRGLKVFTLQHPSRLVIDVYRDRESMEYESSDDNHEPSKKKVTRIAEIVVIDPGHGGYDSGLAKDQYREKNVVLQIAKKLGALVNKSSSSSLLTRGSDRFLSQSDRVDFANSKNAGIFISLHLGNHSGIVIYYPVITGDMSDTVRQHLFNRGQVGRLNDSLTLTKAMKDAFASNFGPDMVTLRSLPYSMLSRIEAASIMVEVPSFDAAEYNDNHKSILADALYKGLYIYEEIKAK